MVLAGIRVLDFSQYLPGPYASLRLAEMGAEVVKIERPGGDPARFLSKGIVFRANNRNKQHITLQLKKQVDYKRALHLIESAHIIIESFRPGVMKRLRLDYETIKHKKPDIIYCSITGYGQESPLSKMGSHDLNYMALSGMLSQMKDTIGKPILPTTTFADYIGGIAASEAILAAYIQQLKTGKGKYIDLAILDALVGLQTNHVLYEAEKISSCGIPEISGENISYHLYETKDGRYVAIAALEKKFWENFCQWAGKPDWVAAHLSSAMDTNKVYEEVKTYFRSYTFSEWLKIAMEVDACLAPVLEMEEIRTYPYMKHRDLIYGTNDGELFVRTTPFKQRDLNSPSIML